MGEVVVGQDGGIAAVLRGFGPVVAADEAAADGGGGEGGGPDLGLGEGRRGERGQRERAGEGGPFEGVPGSASEVGRWALAPRRARSPRAPVTLFLESSITIADRRRQVAPSPLRSGLLSNLWQKSINRSRPEVDGVA